MEKVFAVASLFDDEVNLELYTTYEKARRAFFAKMGEAFMEAISSAQRDAFGYVELGTLNLLSTFGNILLVNGEGNIVDEIPSTEEGFKEQGEDIILEIEDFTYTLTSKTLE